MTPFPRLRRGRRLAMGLQNPVAIRLLDERLVLAILAKSATSSRSPGGLDRRQAAEYPYRVLELHGAK